MPTTKTKSKVSKPKKSALGRGLSALIPDSDMKSLDQTAHLADAANGVQQILLADIAANPDQPRRSFSPQELDELADSIKEHGVLQPVLLRPLHKGNKLTYELVAGERRWRATKIAQLDSIPAIVRQLDDKEALELAIIENVQRQDISALDAALAYRRLQNEFHLSQEEIAQRVAKSRASIANTLRLLDLPEEVQAAINANELSEGHGRAILGAKSEAARRAIFRRVMRDNLTVRQTERLARESDQEILKPSTLGQPSGRNVEERHVEERLQQLLGTKVQLKNGKRGGNIVINYFSAEELERLLEYLGL